MTDPITTVKTLIEAYVIIINLPPYRSLIHFNSNTKKIGRCMVLSVLWVLSVAYLSSNGLGIDKGNIGEGSLWGNDLLAGYHPVWRWRRYLYY